MNPTFRQSVIDAAYAADPVSAAAEYGSEFRSDVSAAFPDDLLDTAMVRGRRSLPPIFDLTYVGFVDMSGGQHDAAVLGIAHKERDRVVLDRLVIAKAPHDPMAVTADFCQTLAGYRITQV